MQKLTDKQLTGPFAAKLFKFYSQQTNSYIVYKQPLEKIQAKTLYQKNKKQFDKLIEICVKYGLDLNEYLKYFILVQKRHECHIHDQLVTYQMIKLFIDDLFVKAQRKKIYKYIMKSANNIADETIKLGFFTTIDFFRYVIKNRMLANYYLTGKISKYYFALIPKFKQLVSKLDPISKDEFQILCNMYEKYNVDSNEALYQERNTKSLKIIAFTDKLIAQKRNI